MTNGAMTIAELEPGPSEARLFASSPAENILLSRQTNFTGSSRSASCPNRATGDQTLDLALFKAEHVFENRDGVFAGCRRIL